MLTTAARSHNSAERRAARTQFRERFDAAGITYATACFRRADSWFDVVARDRRRHATRPLGVSSRLLDMPNVPFSVPRRWLPCFDVGCHAFGGPCVNFEP